MFSLIYCLVFVLQDVTCWFNEHIVPELIWGLNFVLDEFIPEEKKNLTNNHVPLSKELEKAIKMYGFNVSKQIVSFVLLLLYCRCVFYA